MLLIAIALNLPIPIIRHPFLNVIRDPFTRYKLKSLLITKDIVNYFPKMPLLVDNFIAPGKIIKIYLEKPGMSHCGR